MADELPRYRVQPVPVVQKWAKKTLSSVQLREGIKLARDKELTPRSLSKTCHEDLDRQLA